MNIAYLIAAHDQPMHLARMVNALESENSYIFIHIDQRVDISHFQKYVFDCPRLTFLSDSERMAVYWGGFNQVQTALNLVKAAYSSNIPFSRYCLLSGSDYPIKDQAAIQQRLSAPTEYISIDRRLDRKLQSSVKKRHLKNIKRLYWRDNPHLWQRLVSGFIPRNAVAHIPVYHGSQWWSLTHECISYILDFVADCPQYIEFFKHTHCADEMFFHSVVKASPFADHIFQDPKRNAPIEHFPLKHLSSEAIALENVHACHYIDWSTKARSPKVLDMTDIDALNRSPALFARKFRENVSDKLIESLSAEIETSQH